MENWMILTKFSILLFCIFKYSMGETRNIIIIILYSLLYTCLTMLYYIFKNKWLKNILLIIPTILLLICSLNLEILYALLVPINLFELSGRFKFSLLFSAALAALFAIVLFWRILPEYLIVTLLSFQIYMLLSKIYLRIEVIVKENDVLREKNNILSGKLIRDSEYGSQLKHLSQLEERNKIAQEIHDRVGHTISGSLMLLEAAKLIMENDTEKAYSMVQTVIDKLREGMESIRATLRNLKPAAELLGINRVKFLLDEAVLNNQIKTNISYKGDMGVISYIYWKIISENVKEALTNSLKYANATVVWVSIEVLNKFIKIEVKDDGIGTLKVVKGLGIRGIEERSGSVGGKVIFDGTNGFSIIMLLPVEEGNNAN